MSDDENSGPRHRGKGSRQTNIYDVAKRANVSAKTVSRVINDRPDVSSATRARVIEAVEALGYKPNLVARGLALQRSFMIGLFCEAPAAGSNYISRVQTGLLTMCQREGYHLVVECFHGHTLNVEEQVHSLLAESRLSGAVLTPPLSDLEVLIQALVDTQTPIVRFSPNKPRPGVVDVNIDNRLAAYEMTVYLIGIGHKKIGFIKGPADHPDATARFEGYIAGLSDAGLPYRQEYCEEGNYTYKTGMEAGDRLLALADRPSAIFAGNDDMAAGVMASSLRFGLSVPQHLSVAGFDDSLFAQAVWPSLTTCRQPVEEMAFKASSFLIKPNYEGAVGEVHLKHTLVVRGSTAPLIAAL